MSKVSVNTKSKLRVKPATDEPLLGELRHDRVSIVSVVSALGSGNRSAPASGTAPCDSGKESTGPAVHRSNRPTRIWVTARPAFPRPDPLSPR